MNTQKNLMMLTIVISAIYGIWAIFAPGSIMSTYGTPEEFVNPVTLNIVMLFGVAAWVVAILGWHIRSTVTEENVEKAHELFCSGLAALWTTRCHFRTYINLAGRTGTTCLFRADYWRNSFPRFECCLLHVA